MKIGIDIGGSHIAVGLVNEKLEIELQKEHNWTEDEKNNMPNTVALYSKKLIKEIMNEKNIKKIDTIGIGFPSANIKNGIIYKYNAKINFSEILKEFNTKVFVKNDVKCSSLCEKQCGALKNYNNCIFITLGTGIGAAYYYNNKLVSPNTYQGFEIGHMIIDVDGRKCNCGRNGCFEQYASMRVFRQEIEELFNIKDLKSYKMFDIIKSKEKTEEVNKIIDRYVYYLSIGLNNVISIFEPDAICIGGSFAYYSDIFIEKIKEQLNKYFNGREIPDILVAKYANDAGIIGASMLEAN